MTSFIKINALTLVLFTMLAQNCEKDSEGKVTQEEKVKLESVEVKKAAAVADWTKFKMTAESQISIARNQLKSLHIRISNMKGGKKAWLQNEYLRNSQKLNNLVEAFEKLESQQPAPDEYDTATIAKNNSFKSFFLSEILEVNKHLEEILGS